MSAESSANKKMKRRTGTVEDAPAEAQPRTAPKRQRVSRACDQCRAAREKCDGIHPLCFPCASQNRKCSWEEPKKKRGVQTGYIRTLELSLGWIFDKIPGSEEALHGLLTHEGGQGRDLLVGKDTVAGNRLHRRWRKSMVQQEIDRVLSGSTASSAKSTKTSPAVDESESSADETELPLKEETLGVTNPAPIMAIPESIDSMNTVLHPERLASNGPPELPAGLADLPIRQRQLAQYASSTFKLPSNCWRLLDIYFSYTHCWFPILEKGMIHKACWSYPGEGLDMAKEELFQSGLHAELWAALAIAAYQDDASHSGTALGGPEVHLQPDEIYHAARRLIPSEDRDFDARHVNAILLLALVDIGRRKYMAAWILVGLATRVALALNLPSRPPGDGYRRLYHTYMACFMLDSLIASLLEKPPHLRPSDIGPSVPSGEDEPDEWDIWMPCQGFGTTQHSSSPRSPAHSMSSFAALFGVHRVYCTMFTEPKIHVDRNELYITEMRKALNGNQTRRPLADYITNGGIPPYQVPSIYLLRLAFVCFTVQAQSYSEPLMCIALQCIEELLLLFGAAVPPLFGLYMELLCRQCNPELLTGDTRDRWKKAQASVDSVWASSGNGDHQPFSLIRSHDTPTHLSHAQSDVIYPCPPNTNIPGVAQQVHTTSPRHTDPRVDSAPLIQPEAYHEASLSAMANFSTMPRSTQTLDLVDHPNSTSTAVTGRFDLSDIPPQSFHGHGRPSFSSAAFDYDTILDDIASLDRSDRMQSDPQFMANLGFAPGSDLAELLAHDFTSMP